MSCPYSREDLSAYVDAEVDEFTQAAIREHLRACPKCKREVSWLKTLKQMVASLPSLEPDTAVTWNAERRATASWSALRCPVVLPEGSALLDGELPPDEAQTVLVHLAGCEPCYRAYKDLERISEAMAATAPVPVPAGLEARIMAAVEAERGVALRSLFSRTCECFTPVWRVSLRVAAAAALVLAVLFGVWQAIGPRGGAPPAAVVAAPAHAVAAPAEAAPASLDSTSHDLPVTVLRRQPEAGGTVSSPPLASGPSSPGGVRPVTPSGGAAPTIVRPPGDAPVAPGLAGPDRTTPPQPGLTPPRAMLASLPPSQPVPSPDPGAPTASKPPMVPGKSTPGTGEVARPPSPPPVRVAEYRAPGGEAEVHAARSNPGGPTAPASRGIDARNLRAAEARTNDGLRSDARWQPRRPAISH